MTEELVIDSVAVPAEIKEFSPRLYQEILKIIGETDVDEVPFHEFKEQGIDVKGIIRSAEFSPYASVRIVARKRILTSGSLFRGSFQNMPPAVEAISESSKLTRSDQSGGASEHRAWLLRR